MKHYIPILTQSRLFCGVSEEDVAAMLSCLQARLRVYRKGDYVLRHGASLQDVMVLVSGKLLIQKEDYWGNRGILGHLGEGEMFGEAYASPDSGVLLNDVVALEDSAVIFFDVRRIIVTCSSACRFHTTVVQNMVYALAEKNRQLVQKLEHMSKRTTREKLLSYLSQEAARQHSADICIPFNRQQLADYLAVDRSAMSNELGKMRDEGLLTFRKNRFSLRTLS